ncbi:MAG TPA: hypothetical protein VGQ81_09215 [Acidobacteriota bacterium]|jgi:hypothetical protein|nr:hypothetical protein [Acidobacteriota bacterium]
MKNGKRWVQVISTCLLTTMPLCAPGCAQAKAPSWRTYQDPIGFRIELPLTWQVQSNSSKGVVEIRGEGGEQIALRPLFVAGQLFERPAAGILEAVAAQLRPEAKWGRVETAGPTALRLRGTSGDGLALSLFVWTLQPEGTVGTICSIVAPRSSFSKSAETVAKIVGSFRLVSVKEEKIKQQPALQYIQWQDPREKAFSLKVPAGWSINGGAFRFAAVDVRPAWEAGSPEGDIRVTGGDAEIPAFTVPSPLLEMGGLHEGSWYSLGYGVQTMIRRFTSGADFVREYVLQKVARGYSDVNFTEVRDRPEAVRAINKVYAQFGQVELSARLSAGDASFTCRKNGQLFSGYYFAATQLVQHQSGGLWNVEKLFGYVAPAAKVEQAQAVLPTMVQSFEINSDWAAMQQGVVRNVTTIVSRTQAEISKIMADTFEYQQKAREPGLEGFSKATLGVEDVVNPNTGEKFRVQSGFDHYWKNPRGQILGTQTDTYPGGQENWQKLIIEGARN